MKLKIVDTTFNKNIDQIETGELFVVSESDRDEYKLFKGVFIKIQNRKDNRNSVNINTGELFYINNKMLLQRVKGELII